MPDNLVDSSYDIDTIITELHDFQGRLDRIERLLEDMRNSTRLLEDIRDSLRDMSNK